MTWSLAEAKSKLSEVINLAEFEGPQKITRRGKVYILIEEENYQQAIGIKPNFVDFLASGPPIGDLNLERPESYMRKVEL
ncbi:MAG: type II toxin-antitoxin system Phd/YefM family antitoxin [Verrucomicrobiales bacterium]|nr:type II toxin-antitoxin system Phd/YefM family antitoxin [Verrucomicrobiales bacterium]